MNSHVNFAVGIIGSILEDAAVRWPNLQTLFERDLSRLRRDAEARGLSYFTITLPDAGKVLDRALDRGTLSNLPFPQGMKLAGDRPLFLKGLFDRVFDQVGMLRAEADIEAVFFLRQVLYAFKKFRVDCHPSKVKETLDEFFSIEEDLPKSYQDSWDSDVPHWYPCLGHPLWGSGWDRPFESHLFGVPECPSIPWDYLHNLCVRIARGELGLLPDWDLFPRHGPGAVAEATGGAVKYDFPNWPRKLNGRFPYDWFGTGSLDTGTEPAVEEPSSVLIAVPKTSKGPRLICKEPTAHQWIQQGILRWLEERVSASPLLRLSIDFHSQERSRERALSASHSQESATIDLSSASDRVSTRLVQFMFEGNLSLLDGLHACRTRTMVQHISDSHPKMIVLRKFSTMGSAVTFPIQTIVFTLLTVFAVRLADGRRDLEGLEETFREITVFGDDIIAPVRAWNAINLVFDQCGLRININKSYGGSNFRESCGCDAFRGVDVTPAKVLEPYDGSPSSMAATVELSNHFHTKGFWKAADLVASQLPIQERKRISILPTEEGGVLSLRTFCRDVPVPQTKWDPVLQRRYYTALTTTSKVEKVVGSGNACLTQYFTECPDPELPWSSGQAGRVRLRKCLTRIYL